MASRSRFLVRLFIAALPVFALLPGCYTMGGQKPFRFANESSMTKTKPPGLVEIGSDCHASPEIAVVDVAEGRSANPRDQLLWHVTGKQARDRVVISAKEAEKQAARGLSGQSIRDLFQSEYEIPESFDAIRSGQPRGALPLLKDGKGKVVWKYNITYYRNGAELCRYDPRVCVERNGTTVCYDS
jgi:hypothetical protein